MPRNRGQGLGLCALTLLLLTPALARAQDHPRLGLHMRLFQNGFPIILGGNIDGPLDASVLDAMSRYHEVTFSASPASEYRPDIATELRTRRPGIHLLGYVLAELIYDAPMASDSTVHLPSRIRRLVRDDGGWLYNRSGGIYSFVNINFAKRTGARYQLAEDLADLYFDAVVRTGMWDGMFFDYLCNSVSWSQTTAESIDVVRAGYPNQAAFDAAWLAGTDAFSNRLRSLTGPDFILVGNCGLGTSYSSMNGWMRENFPNQNGGTWYDNMYREPGGYLTDETRFRQPTHGYIFSAYQPPYSAYDPRNTRKQRFGLASAALAEGYGIFAPSDLDVTLHPHEYWWYDEYGVDLVSGRADSSIAHTGWLGQPLGPMTQMVWAGSGLDAVSNPDFESNATSGWNFAAATPASVTRDATTAGHGAASAHIHINSAAPAEYWVTYNTQGTLNVTANNLYSATFWAKASQPFHLPVVAGVQGGVLAAYRAIDIDTTWTQYQVALTPSTSMAVQLQFYVGLLQGDLWLDDVHLQAGASSIFRRDFQNGTVLVNPATSTMTVPLGRPFRRILGFRDTAVNDGATVTQVSVPPSDALFLIGTDVTPPAPISDLHPEPN